MALPDLTPKPLTKAARRAFDAICDEWFETARARSGQLGLSVPEPLATELRDQALAQIEEPAPWTSCPSPLLQRLVLPHLTAIGSPVLEGFAVVEGVSVVHVLRLVRLLGSDQERLFRTAVAAANAEAMGWGDLRVVAEAYRFCALPTTELLAEYLAEPVHPWATTIWPSFADHLDHLASALSGPRPAAWRCWAEGAPDRDRVLAVVAAFPTLPAELVEPLWRMGLGRDRDGGAARRQLERLEDLPDRLVAALGDGKHEVRAGAARWIGERRQMGALEPLRRALATEKSDVPRAAMMDALELLGEPLEDLIDRDAALREATRKLKKGVGDKLGWFPFDRLPTVRWMHDEQPVPSTLVIWWLVQSMKLASPAPSALLTRYRRLLRRDDREALADAVLAAWLGGDPHCIEDLDEASRAELEARVAANVEQYGLSEERARQWISQEYVLRPKSRALAVKGVLALVAAFGGSNVVRAVESYLNTWYGWRAGQCKALLQMIAWLEDRSAVALLLTTGTRFRTKGIQKEAELQARALADRKGWSLAELSDRTTPTAGLDQQASRSFVYGTQHLEEGAEEPRIEATRRFVARFTHDLAIVVTDDEGRVLPRGLPSARKGEDEALARAAKKELSQLQRTVRKLTVQQTERLYEAMCAGQGWPLGDWRDYLATHPITGRLVHRLLWRVEGDEWLAVRPLEDGVLSTLDDGEAHPPDDAIVQVLHRSHLDAEAADAWRRHLDDYRVIPLFDQLGALPVPLGDGADRRTAMADFEGHLIESFKLRGEAKKLGFLPAPAEDGGWLQAYRRTYPTIGIVVDLEFSGIRLPQDNRPVALTRMTFRRSSGEGGSRPLPLGDLPEVLLFESHHQLAVIAAAGSGFHPDWRRKVE